MDYEELLPALFNLAAGNFYVALAGEKDRRRVSKITRQYRKPDQWVFVGVIAPIGPHVETRGTAFEKIRARVLCTALAAEVLGAR